VGLPLATEFASKGFKATGFEVDESKAACPTRAILTSAMLIPRW
jgi:UDP-N-acetyl-D-mannosaminuronate dehydrogenase